MEIFRYFKEEIDEFRNILSTNKENKLYIKYVFANEYKIQSLCKYLFWVLFFYYLFLSMCTSKSRDFLIILTKYNNFYMTKKSRKQ